MTFLKIIHIYLLIGAVTGLYFNLSKVETAVLPIFIYLALTGYLIFLFFKHNRTLLFNSLLFILILQLISIKTLSLGYLLSVGLCFFIGFGIDSPPARETLLAFSASDFSPVAEGQNEIVGINLLAVVVLLLLILTKEK
jgi:hypothetical protein